MLFPLRDDNPHPVGFRPYVTYALIAVNSVAFLMVVFHTGQFFDFTNQNAFFMYYDWGAVPYCVTGGDSITVNFGSGPITIDCPNNPYLSLITSTFLHGGLMHFGGNMLFLWIFGDNIEQKFGRLKYLGIYILWGVAAGLIHILGDVGSITPAVGASGAISGIMGAYLIMFPRARITTFVMFVIFWRLMHIQARWFLPFWLVFLNILPFFVGGFGVAGGGVAYLAHIGGFLVGLLSGYIYKKISRDESGLYGTRYGYRPDYRSDYR